jgi:P27 family predicted phage terminase small subunit
MPAKLPTATKQLRGTLRPGRANAREPQPTPGVPRPSRELGLDVQREFKKLARRLRPLRVAASSDGLALELAASVMAEYWRYEETIQKLGATYETKTPQGSVMIRPRPEVALAADAWRRAAAMLAAFGLTPVARSRVETLPSDPASSRWAGLLNDPLERMLRRREGAVAEFQRQRPVRPGSGGAP